MVHQMPDHSRVHSLDVYDLFLVYFSNYSLHCSSQPSLLSISEQVIFILVLWTALLMLQLRMCTHYSSQLAPCQSLILGLNAISSDRTSPCLTLLAVQYTTLYISSIGCNTNQKNYLYLCVYYLFSSVTYIHKYRPYMTCSLPFSQHSQ